MEMTSYMMLSVCLVQTGWSLKESLSCWDDQNCAFLPSTEKHCKDTWGPGNLCINSKAWCQQFGTFLNKNCPLTCKFCSSRRSCPCEAEWSQWSECRKADGLWESYRVRDCDASNDCLEATRQAVQCNGRSFFDWSSCARSCGGGTKWRFTKCLDLPRTNCPKQYEDCNSDACPSISCSSNEVHRYNTSSGCCKPDISSSCGEFKISSNIINGLEAKPFEWTWMVFLQIGPNNKGKYSFCGASLINSEWALTAAHCVDELKYKPHLFDMRAGIRNLRNHGQRRVARRVFVHPGYRGIVADIALLLVDVPFEIATNLRPEIPVRPICLPRGEITPIDAHCYAVGWGATDPDPSDHSLSRKLQVVKLRNLDVDACAAGYKNDSMVISDINRGVLCAGALSGGYDTCAGDSGGPLMCQRCRSCSWYVAGITSYGASTCAVAKRPGIYSKVVEHELWIEITTGKIFGETLFQHEGSCDL